ncbi:hypothetical protein [Phormidesmis priestleyi]|uniref:hypothetical protein n=1 Tax=Phormidesmis priestleyi TaxID=268141 RepID=UPI000934C0C8|nr:hypothetical protein [Phormidesmis priestleyi]
MNLPFVLDIAIGLAFVYLILSLLVSEIQELLSTLLQWRAAHLKKSIETLLTGGEGTANDKSVKTIVESLYSNPLIKNISHESKEGIESWLRQITRFVITLGRKDKLTLKGDEPSYMPSETFATTLLEKLSLSQLTKKMTALNLKLMVKEEILDKLDSYLNQQDLQIKDETRQNLTADLIGLRLKLEAICTDFSTEKATLLTCVNRLRDELNSFIETTKLLAPTNALKAQDDTSTEQQGDPEIVKFVSQIKSLKNGIFYQGNPDSNNTSYSNTDELIRRLQPSLAQTLDLGIGEVRNEQQQVIRVSDTYQLLQNRFGNLDPNDKIYKAYDEIRKDVEAIGQTLPPSVRESLAALSRRAQINVKRAQVQYVEDELYQFKGEIQIWFDRSMDRASGVYKRNAKGVTFLIGFLIALVVNADTFHMVSRLTTDPTLRDALAKKAEVATNIECLPPSPSDTTTGKQLKCLRDQVNRSIPLPIGRDSANLEQQTEESSQWFFPPLRMILGWLLSGLAISMGAPFWFELLGKFINVRNSGSKPTSTANQTTANRSTADQATVNQETSK